MTKHFDDELAELKIKLLYMSGLVEEMVQYSIKALVERKEELTEEVFKREEEVNSLQVEIDDRSLKLIALYQPAAADLRFVTSAMKINSELERMGDQAVNIADASKELLKFPQLKKLIDIPMMSDIVKSMVKHCLDSFVRKDADLAREVLIRDNQVDGLKDQIFRELLTYMLSETKHIPVALELILISRHLERIGDHATNIAEDVIFMVKGADVRHHIKEL
ncbi:MAG: phosphate signaling complex protein PhoU [Candidatus Firestonebacteria bacterium]